MGLRSIINSLFKRGNPNVRGITDRVFISLYAYRVLYYCFTYVSPIRTVIALFLSVLSICGDINKGRTAISLVIKRVRFKARCDIKCNLPKLSKIYYFILAFGRSVNGRTKLLILKYLIWKVDNIF